MPGTPAGCSQGCSGYQHRRWRSYRYLHIHSRSTHQQICGNVWHNNQQTVLAGHCVCTSCLCTTAIVCCPPASRSRFVNWFSRMPHAAVPEGGSGLRPPLPGRCCCGHHPPDCACWMTSRPLVKGTIPFCWMAEGFSKPAGKHGAANVGTDT